MMFKGNWKCSGCGGTITELPFEPRGEAGLTCRGCYFKEKNGDTSGTSAHEVAPPANAGIDDREAPPFGSDEGSVATEPAPEPPEFTNAPTASPGERPKFTGDWKCASCGGSITSLPFEPRETGNLKCVDCFKKSKNP